MIEELEILSIEEIESDSNLYDVTVEDNHNFFANNMLVHNCEVIYEKGKFVRAVTRGDGREGDDISANAVYFEGMVKELGECMDCAVRGEVVILKEHLHEINDILVAKGKDPLKNTRNGVAGQATKFKDRDEKILELITFIAYEVQVFGIHETGEVVA